jgi:hypothetical protein
MENMRGECDRELLRTPSGRMLGSRPHFSYYPAVEDPAARVVDPRQREVKCTKAIAIGRSKALLEKIREGRYHPEFRSEDAIRILENSLGIGDTRSPSSARKRSATAKPPLR